MITQEEQDFMELELSCTDLVNAMREQSLVELITTIIFGQTEIYEITVVRKDLTQEN